MLTPDFRPKIDWDAQRNLERQCIAIGAGVVAVTLLTWWLAESDYNPVGSMLKLAFKIIDPVYKLFL